MRPDLGSPMETVFCGRILSRNGGNFLEQSFAKIRPESSCASSASSLPRAGSGFSLYQRGNDALHQTPETALNPEEHKKLNAAFMVGIFFPHSLCAWLSGGVAKNLRCLPKHTDPVAPGAPRQVSALNGAWTRSSIYK